MSDKQERLTEAELDRTLKVYLAHKATRSMAEIAKKQYMEGKTNTSEFLEMTAAMADSLWEKAGEKGAPSIDVKKEMMEAHNIFADKELQEVMDMEEKRKETRAKIKATKDPLEGYKTKVESAILANQMSPMAAATATILLGLSGPESQEMSADERIAEWLSIFVDETCSSRLLAFNVQVAESVAGGMRQWRKVLKRLDAPLVPETERLAHLNRITLEAAENEKQRSTTQRIEGGGTHTTRPTRYFSDTAKRRQRSPGRRRAVRTHHRSRWLASRRPGYEQLRCPHGRVPVKDAGHHYASYEGTKNGTASFKSYPGTPQFSEQRERGRIPGQLPRKWRR
nr:unnamed protein product [Leishmania braziliensis]